MADGVFLLMTAAPATKNTHQNACGVPCVSILHT